jgi:hypothetical protein
MSALSWGAGRRYDSWADAPEESTARIWATSPVAIRLRTRSVSPTGRTRRNTAGGGAGGEAGEVARALAWMVMHGVALGASAGVPGANAQQTPWRRRREAERSVSMNQGHGQLGKTFEASSRIGIEPLKAQRRDEWLAVMCQK